MRAKRIAAAMHEQRRGGELRKVRGAQLHRLARRVQRIREQQQAGGNTRLLSSQRGGLASAVRMSAEKDPAGYFLAQNSCGPADAFAIACCHSGKWRPVRAQLAKRKIEAQHQKAGLSESARQRRSEEHTSELQSQ